MANNHMGDVHHGIKIIREFKKVTEDFKDVFQFAFKLQLRDPSIIHPDYTDRLDLKNIKRFTETRLSPEDFGSLYDEIKNSGFISMCTPFDEIAVETMVKMDFDIFKIASCSFADWSLMESLSDVDKPIIISTACAELTTVDKVVSFFKHRNKDFCLMHCVSAYPTKDSELEINQIDFLKQRYDGISIGFSTHETPDCMDSVKIAIAKGSMVFEKHVGISTEEYALNQYSAQPQQVSQWLNAAVKAYEMCGGSPNNRMTFTKESKAGILPFVRGCFVKSPVKKGQAIQKDNIFLAIPNVQEQLLAYDLSKYTTIEAMVDMEANAPILYENVAMNNSRAELEAAMHKVDKIIQDANIAIPNGVSASMSVPYGLEKFYDYGLVAFDILNREYCKKILVLLPNQNHPTHHHKVKEETFHILSGEVNLQMDGVEYALKKGDLLTINRGQNHSFSTSSGAVIEEISTTHIKTDSYYDDIKITNNENRKIELNFYHDFFRACPASRF